MSHSSWLWALFTVIAAASQTIRNAAQRELTAKLGTVGATHVRFLFGLPFALVLLAAVLLATGSGLPDPGAAYWIWVLVGALTQVAATALMLAAMNDRSFVVVYAYVKTEPVQVALFSVVLIGEVVTPSAAVAILLATSGVVLMGLRPGATRSVGATLLGLGAGGLFGLSAIGFRAAILNLGSPNYFMAATFTMVTGLLVQVALLSIYLWVRDPAVTRAIFHTWRPSTLVGFLGALASQFWFLAFALAPAASVRTLALVEVLFAQAISRVVFGQRTTPREGLGIVLIVIGVGLLMWAY